MDSRSGGMRGLQVLQLQCLALVLDCSHYLLMD